MSRSGGRPAPRPRRRPTAAPASASRGALRVIAGSVGGLRLDAPPGSTTRPTADRVRQATFNALDSLGVVDGAQVIDAFAGSGALGIEALSRGAERVTFVEADLVARSVVEGNLRATGFVDRARVVPGDGYRELAAAGPWDLVLLDPPYDYDRWPDLLEAVAASLAPDGVVVLESDHELALPASLRDIRLRRYGSTVVTFASPAGATS